MLKSGLFSPIQAVITLEMSFGVLQVRRNVYITENSVEGFVEPSCGRRWWFGAARVVRLTCTEPPSLDLRLAQAPVHRWPGVAIRLRKQRGGFVLWGDKVVFST